MRDTEKIITAAIAGTAIGIGAGMLLAPEKGSVTRYRLAEKGRRVADSVKEKMGSGHSYGSDMGSGSSYAADMGSGRSYNDVDDDYSYQGDDSYFNDDDSNTLGIITAAIAGTAIGVAAGMLLAPDKGSVTRERIAEQGRRLADKGRNVVDTVKDKINTVRSSMSNRNEDSDSMNTGGMNTGGMNSGGMNSGGMNSGGMNTGGNMQNDYSGNRQDDPFRGPGTENPSKY
ncbi:MAG: YtxH domain-containing protein [Chitinophagales bacterium]|nr:YtxH domain-containing protein [Chitinophagales bacterium]